MPVLQVVVRVDEQRRIRLYAEGGLDMEAFVPDVGWVLDNQADVSDATLGAYLIDARNIVADAAANFCRFEVAGSAGNRD